MQPTYKKSTIKDVARMARVSTSTISAFVAGRESVCSAETAERIRRVIADLRYTPNSLTQGLRKNHTKTVGIAFDITKRNGLSTHSSYIERAWLGICAEVDNQKYSLLYYPNYIREQELFHMYLDGRSDGLIFNLSLEDPIGSYIASAGMPAVVIGRSPEYAGGCAVVYAEEREAIDLALQHLWSLGHRRIGFLAGPDGAWTGIDGHGVRSSYIAIERTRCFRKWMADRGVFREELMQKGRDWGGDYGIVNQAFNAWSALADNMPTAVLCANDNLALSLMSVAMDHGLSVPGDLSIIGIDHITSGAERRPSLTSVEIDADAIGRQAVKSLLRIIAGESPADCHVKMSVSRLIVRESTASI